MSIKYQFNYGPWAFPSGMEEYGRYDGGGGNVWHEFTPNGGTYCSTMSRQKLPARRSKPVKLCRKCIKCKDAAGRNSKVSFLNTLI